MITPEEVKVGDKLVWRAGHNQTEVTYLGPYTVRDQSAVRLPNGNIHSIPDCFLSLPEAPELRATRLADTINERLGYRAATAHLPEHELDWHIKLFGERLTLDQAERLVGDKADA